MIFYEQAKHTVIVILGKTSALVLLYDRKFFQKNQRSSAITT